ncbi:MAG: hypothetical protein BGO78_17350 [Chloroflexi bacterium 44-23]|nr:MAG: hypothetical protein BGO78_17350 [Chloroflexi bacterium 44-23]
MVNLFESFIGLVRTISDILTAGIAITAFSLLLYALTFNLRDRVARSFALIMICVVIVFTAEALGGITQNPSDLEVWLRIQWVGVILLPPTYLHFSDALVATTGRPSRWRRKWAVRLTYIFSLGLLTLLPTNILIGPLVMESLPAPHLQRTIFTDLFTVYYSIIMILSWANFARAYIRTVTPASRRRMGYLVVSALAPALGSFPFLLFGSEFASRNLSVFWILAMLVNVFVGIMLVVMAYATAFIGVSWSDRVVKSRLLNFLLRGPLTASLVLAITTLLRRTGIVFGLDLDVFVPIAMVVTIILSQYFISLLAPLGEKWLFYGDDQQDLDMVKSLTEHLLTRNDLLEFLEMILATVIDRLQSKGAYLIALGDGGLELVIASGMTQLSDHELSEDLTRIVAGASELPDVLRWNQDLLFPLYESSDDHENTRTLLGLMGVTGVDLQELDLEQRQSINLLIERASLALRDRQMQLEIFHSMEKLSRRVDYIQRLRARGRYDSEGLFNGDEWQDTTDLLGWVKDALTHFWGGPKLTESPLMELQIVQEATIQNEGNKANALRAILREAIKIVKPEGERRFTGEWILYNILEMKFLEGKKVREIAVKLSMSEADLYRKQRVAIEAVAKAVVEMERDSQVNLGTKNGNQLLNNK